MAYIQTSHTNPIRLRLARNLVRTIKRGHPWVFAEALRQCPPAPAGHPAILLDNKKGREIARGFYDANSPLALRICSVEPGLRLDDAWAEQPMSRALQLRRSLFGTQTTAYRLFNGEGDGLPGLICDVYQDSAVIQLDGDGPAGFWNVDGIARWVADQLDLPVVFHKSQSRSNRSDRALVGAWPREPVYFRENGVDFTADVVAGQKTGFFLDQRDNRQLIREFAQGRRVLNLFGYTGGFSVYAGLGGAAHATTVDLAAPAVQAAEFHWQLNGLPAERHSVHCGDVFDFLEEARQKKQAWDLVVVDPPSFAAAKSAVKRAKAAYQQLNTAAASVTDSGGILAAASCSSHIDLDTFLSICEESVSAARRRATLLAIRGQPADHPSPLAFPEFRYLKFVLMRLD